MIDRCFAHDECVGQCQVQVVTDALVAAEREECAKVEDQFAADMDKLRDEMPVGSVMRFQYELRGTDARDRADAIRSRGQP